MSSVHRLAWIDGQIREGRHPNATTIARRFEISRRQAARDIEYLRHSLGAPLEFSAAKNGYHYSHEGFVMPSVVLTEAERSALSYLAGRYGALSGEGAAKIASLLARLSGRTVIDRPSESLPPVATVDSRELRAKEAVEWAIENREKVVVRYRGLDGAIVPRTLSPLALRMRHGMWSCMGYCDELGLILWLPISRFETVDATGDRFVPPGHADDPDREELTAPPEPYFAVVRLDDPRDAERIESASVEPDGTHRIEFRDSAAILSALLGCRSPFEILSPRWLRLKLAALIQALADRNGST